MRAARSARTWSRGLCCLWLCCLLPFRTLAVSPGGSLRDTDTKREQPLPISILHSLPLQFEENKGQADKKTRFLVRGAEYTLLLDQDGLRLDLRQRHQISMNLVGAQTVSIAGREPSPTKTNYYLGNNPADWLLDVRTYRSVAYSGVYRGIDLIYHGSGQELEYDFVVAPHADPSQVRMRFGGLQPRLLGEDLAFHDLDGLRVKALKAYQWVDGKKEMVEASWQLHGDEASVRLGAYDKDRELIIDPVFFYGTYIGGLASDTAVSVVAASQPGYYYVALSTSSDSLSDPPPGSASSTVTGTLAMIVGIDATGSPGPSSPLPPYSSNQPTSYPSLLVSSVTYVGGTTGNTTPTDMVGDQSGNLYITGITDNGANFVPPAKQPCSPSCTGFVAQFATSIDTGTTPAKATVTQKYRFGLPAMPMAIAVDTSGDVYLTGDAYATSGKPMLTIPLDDTTFQSMAAAAIGTGGNLHAFLLELDPTGATLFCSYIGGSGSDHGNALALSGNSVFVAGQTTSTDFPKTSNDFQQNNNGGQDGFVLAASKLSTSPSLDFSTYLGGSGTDAVTSIAVTPAGNPVVTGYTTSSSQPTFPIQPNPSFVQLTWPTPIFSTVDNNGSTDNTSQVPTKPPRILKLPTTVTAGNRDAFVTSLSGDGTHLLFTDFLGGDDPNDVTSGQAVTVDSIGAIYVTGSSTGAPPTVASNTVPPTAPPSFLPGAAIGDLPPSPINFDTTPQGTITNIFFTEIDPTGGYLLEATIAGGFGTDQANGLTISGPLASSGVVTIVGSTTADPNPVDLSNHPDFFESAGISATNPVQPDIPGKGDVKNTTGFLVQEALAGYCKMQLTAQTGTLLTFTGPCVSGTQSGTLFAVPLSPPSSGPTYLSAPIAVNASGSSLSASVTIDTSSLGGATADFTFAFFPLGAVGGVGQCDNNTNSLTTCVIVTAGGGAGTLFKVTSGTLTVSLACSGDNCNYNGAPNTALVGQPVALSATVTNGIPNTVTWTSSQGVFTGNNPASSIMFTPNGSGGPVVVQATPVANPSVTPTTIALTTIGGPPTPGGSLVILSSTSKMVAGTSFQFTATQPVTWTATSGKIDPNTGQFTAPNPPPAAPEVTITATTQTTPSSSVATQVTVFPQPVLVVPPNTTLPAGGSVSVPISLTAGTGIPGESLLFTCSPASLPTGVSCSFTPNPVTNNGSAQLTLKLSSTAVGELLPLEGVPSKPFSWGGFVVVFTGCMLWSRRRTRWPRGNDTWFAAVALGFLFVLTACGTGGSFSTTSQQGHLGGNYTISITVMGNTQGAADLNQTVATANLAVKLQ